MRITLETSNIINSIKWNHLPRTALACLACKRMFRPDTSFAMPRIPAGQSDGAVLSAAKKVVNFFGKDIRRVPDAFHTAAAILPQDSDAKMWAHLAGLCTELFTSEGRPQEEEKAFYSRFYTIFCLYIAPELPKTSLAIFSILTATNNIELPGPVESVIGFVKSKLRPQQQTPTSNDTPPSAHQQPATPTSTSLGLASGQNVGSDVPH